MTDEVQTDATKALADTKATIATLDTDVSKAKVWYASHLFYAGMIATMALEGVAWLIHKVL